MNFAHNLTRICWYWIWLCYVLTRGKWPLICLVNSISRNHICKIFTRDTDGFGGTHLGLATDFSNSGNLCVQLLSLKSSWTTKIQFNSCHFGEEELKLPHNLLVRTKWASFLNYWIANNRQYFSTKTFVFNHQGHKEEYWSWITITVRSIVN